MLKTRLSPRTQPRHCVRARVKAQSHNYQLDANGSLLRDGLRSYEFDAANRLGNVTTGVGIDAPTTRYVHNALGQRVFKTEPLYAPVSSGSNPADPGVMQTLANFFASLWGGSTTTAAPSASEKLGYTYYYDEDGSLLYEQGSGGANSGGSAHYVYLPTPAGPMPVATYTGSKHYAVHTDHLNTPRRLTNSAKQVAWQWAFSAFGDEQPTTARNRYVDPATTPNAGTTTVAEVTFNLRYPGQYFDKESGLSYNYFRSYDSRTGRYNQSDPISLDGGWNKFTYAYNNPFSFSDPTGLFVPGNHSSITADALKRITSPCPNLPAGVAMADFLPGSQNPKNAHWHAMRDGTDPNENPATAQVRLEGYIKEQLSLCTCDGLARALHATQDSFAAGHAGGQPWSGGLPSTSHVYNDSYPSEQVRNGAVNASVSLIRRYKETCEECKK